MGINKFQQELVSSIKTYNASFEVGEKPVDVWVKVSFDGEYEIEWEFRGSTESDEYTDEELDEIENFISNNY